MKLKQDKQYLLDRIDDCINAYPEDKSWHEGEDMKKPLKAGWKGAKNDMSVYDKYEEFHIGTENGFVWYRTIQGEKVFGVTYTGTKTPIQWLMNFLYGKEDEAKLNDAPYGYKTETGVAMHYGFKTGYDMTQEFVIDKTDEAIRKHGVKTIATDGHSRGAPLSGIYALDVSKKFAEDAGLITVNDINVTLWASPRFVNEAGMKSYNKRVPNTISIINRNDPVCNVPSDGLGFRAVAQKKTFRVGMEWFDYLAPSCWLCGILNVTPFVTTNLISVGVGAVWSSGDHYPMYYKATMAKYAIQ